MVEMTLPPAPPRKGRRPICHCEQPDFRYTSKDGRLVCAICEGLGPVEGQAVAVIESGDAIEIEPDSGPPPAESWTPDSDDFVTVRGGGLYLPARRRIQWMRGPVVAHPEWTIDTEILEHERGLRKSPVSVTSGYALVRANVYDGDGRLIATGIKSEYSENFADYIEKAETGAIARALAVAGYGTESALDLDEGFEKGRIADSPVGAKARPYSIGHDGATEGVSDRAVTLGPSAVAGVGRGGKTEAVSVLQIKRVADLSRQLGLGASGLSVIIEGLMGVTLDGVDDSAIATFLSRRSGDEVGRLIEALEEQAHKPTSLEETADLNTGR